MRKLRIVTRYHGATNTSGSCIAVRWGGKVRKIPYDYAAHNAHQSAVEQAFDKWGLVIQDIEYLKMARGGYGNVYTVTVEEG